MDSSFLGVGLGVREAINDVEPNGEPAGIGQMQILSSAGAWMVGTLVAADEDDAAVRIPGRAVGTGAMRTAGTGAMWMVQGANNGWVMGEGLSVKVTASKGRQWPWW